MKTVSGFGQNAFHTQKQPQDRVGVGKTIFESFHLNIDKNVF
jgi:hypothetical protein